MNDRYEQTMRISRLLKRGNYNLIEVWECEIDKKIAENAEMRDFMQNVDMLKRAPLDCRDAFFGGRTESTLKYVQKDCKYFDVRSLYPSICKNGEFPLGHPKIYVGQECRALTGQENRDVSKINGLVKCEILPPSNLYFPVLPVRMHGKLLFPLCRSCCEQSLEQECPHGEEERSLVGTWVGNEVRVAVEQGYRVLDIFEIWQYEMTRFDPVTGEGGLFAGYIDEFFRLKAMASGYPQGCDTEEQKDAYIEEIRSKEGISLEKDGIRKNPGLRSVMKLLLNTLWGKFAQTENMPKNQAITDPKVLFDLLLDPEVEVSSWLPVNDQVCYVGWSHKKEAAKLSGLTNVVIASFVTAQARLKLYSYLKHLGARCAYLDTDSILFQAAVCPNEYEPPLGPLLGDLSDELEDYGSGSKIVEFVSGGPKFYAFKVLKPNGEAAYVCKVKGIRLNHETSSLVNFESIKQMIVQDSEPIFVTPRNIRHTL